MGAPAAAAPASAGTQVVLGGSTYTLLPLTFGAWKRNANSLRALADGAAGDVDAIMDAITDVVHQALLRAQPGLARATVEDALDWPLAQQLYMQVLAISVPAAPPGEMTVASPPGASTGTS
jgi:hypothetical protein